MAISTAALASIIALGIIVLISCFKEMNVGILGIAAALLVGILFSGMKIAAIFKGWPIGLFMILIGVTFMFACAQVNGTMEKFSAYAVRLAKGNTALIPIILFLLITVITTIGPGNIATTALMAPMAMAIAGRIGLSAFAMTLLVVGAANGAAFSPFAPTGIISNGLIAKMAPQLGLTDLQGLAWKVHWNSEIVQGVVNFGGFFLFGGLAWMRKQRGGSSLNIDEIAPKPEPFTAKQWATLAGIAALIFSVIVLKWDVGAVAFGIGAIFMLFGIADDAKAVKAMPWGVILMVCGMSVLIDVMDQAGGLNALVSMIATVSNPTTVNGVLGLITGIISAYSSSSGVVMPMFLPMVPGLIQQIGGGDPVAMISSINIGSHIVDTSPLSTLGALCIACAAEHEDKAKLFRNLMLWGLSMSVVGAIVCYIAFGILGL
ncbi:Dicarboxylate carrier MatC domain protein [Thermosinus carboxydivorans Nor1]|uniref:Dicarboxylate carrier MatC domain protein n=1 Tax=Thermosinus carboxydivorans Nor1 TaxID=401526 RepID=A1HP25_9FIRM|nr:SLC13 family permease [Thermosinus carboxydivorans]EAX48133.1 Dicarboxylate carrier MatC domain protein [Thermosinus carboxydivorans Nor1]